MQWNMHYEICATIFLTLLVMVYYWQKRLPLLQNRLFGALLILAPVANAMDVITCITSSYADLFPLWLHYALNCLAFTLMTCMCLLYWVYSRVLAGQYRFFRSRVAPILCIPALAMMLLILTNPLTKLVFDFRPVDGVLRYTHGPLWEVLFVTAAFYLLLSAAYMLYRRKQIARSLMYSVFFVNICLLVGIVLQSVFFQNVLLTYFAFAPPTLLFYATVQNPARHIERPLDVFNRDAFVQRVADLSREARAFHCGYVLIDDYAMLGGLFGVETLSGLLRGVADTLGARLPGCEIFYMGDARFAVIATRAVPEIDLTDEIALPASAELSRVACTLSAAFFRCPEHAKDLDETLRMIDYLGDALLAQGRHARIDADARFTAQMRRGIAIRQAVERAVEQKGIRTVYQPIYHVKTGSFTSVEALARLRDDVLGDVPPDAFIPMAEQSGKITELGLLVFENACRMLAESRATMLGVRTAQINLSPLQCAQTGMAEALIAVAERHRVPMTRFIFEVTESAAANASEAIRINIDRLIEAGALFSLDDFGKGYSNLTTLTTLPFSIVKLDKALIDACASDDHTVSHLIPMFRYMGLEVMAEGVENGKQVETLCGMGCQYLQGYHFTRPLEEEQLAPWLMRQNGKIA